MSLALVILGSRAEKFRLPSNRIPVLPSNSNKKDGSTNLRWMDDRVQKSRLGAPPISRNVTEALIESISVLDGYDEFSARNLSLLSNFVGTQEARLATMPLPDFKLNDLAYPVERQSVEYLHLSDGNLRRKSLSVSGKTKVVIHVAVLSSNPTRQPPIRPQDIVRAEVSNGVLNTWISILDSPQEQLLVVDIDDDYHGQVDLQISIHTKLVSGIGIWSGKSDDAACLFRVHKSDESMDIWQFDWVDEHMFQTMFMVPHNQDQKQQSKVSFSLLRSIRSKEFLIEQVAGHLLTRTW